MNDKYEFKQFETALIAFISNLSGKINSVFPEIPVVLENIDDGYFLMEKYSKTEYKELYAKVPRIVLSLNDLALQQEQNTTKYIKFNYKVNETNFNSQFRFTTFNFTIELKFVVSNYLMALRYAEFITSILTFDNAFTYIYNGNNYEATYYTESGPQIEKNIPNMATGESRNTIINCTITYQFRPTIINMFNTRKDNIDELSISDMFIDNIMTEPNSNTPLPVGTTLDENGNIVVVNSKPNSHSPYNDIGLNCKDEKAIINSKNTLKKANNFFKIYAELKDGKMHHKETYQTILDTRIR